MDMYFGDNMLSIVVPCCGGRPKRVEAIISRLSLNKQMHPDIEFELIVVDGSSTAEYKEMAEYCARFFPIKYISIPIGRFINAGYPRNCGLRFAEGDVFAGIDIDYWLSENYVRGVMRPFLEGRKVLNQGYVIDSNKTKNINVSPHSDEGKRLVSKINDLILSDKAAGAEIWDVYRKTGIPTPRPWNKVWIWAAPAENCIKMRGYDEIFCRKFAYCLEDDDWFYRLKKQLPVENNHHEDFCAIHLWHYGGQRNQNVNNLNRQYYKRIDGQNPKNIIRNVCHPYGRLLKYSFVSIDGHRMNTEDAEKWLADRGKISYKDDPEWPSLDAFMQGLEEHWRKTNDS